jgi:hypothetical protein
MHFTKISVRFFFYLNLLGCILCLHILYLSTIFNFQFFKAFKHWFEFKILQPIHMNQISKAAAYFFSPKFLFLGQTLHFFLFFFPAQVPSTSRFSFSCQPLCLFGTAKARHKCDVFLLFRLPSHAAGRLRPTPNLTQQARLVLYSFLQ